VTCFHIWKRVVEFTLNTSLHFIAFCHTFVTILCFLRNLLPIFEGEYHSPVPVNGRMLQDAIPKIIVELEGQILRYFDFRHKALKRVLLKLNAVCEQMGRTPPWIEGLLLRADGYECQFYQKS